MKSRILAFSLAATIALALPAACPFADIGGDSGHRIEIVRAATARIVFSEGQHLALFTGAELAYGELTLAADSIEHNSAKRTVALAGTVRLQTPEYSLDTAECFVELATGRVTAEGGLELANTAEGVTLKADRGSFWAVSTGDRVLRAKLSGNVSAGWDEGITLHGSILETDFELRTHTIAGGFTGTVSPVLLPPPLDSLSGDEMNLSGRDLTIRQEEGMPQIIHLAASAVRISGESLGFSGPDLRARLALTDESEMLAENGMVHLSGPPSEPVSGWFLDWQGERLSFSAQSVEKSADASELMLKNDVQVTGPDFSLHAQTVSVLQEEQGFRVTIPQRFRVVISPEVFQSGSSLNEHIEDA